MRTLVLLVLLVPVVALACASPGPDFRDFDPEPFVPREAEWSAPACVPQAAFDVAPPDLGAAAHIFGAGDQALVVEARETSSVIHTIALDGTSSTRAVETGVAARAPLAARRAARGWELMLATDEHLHDLLRLDLGADTAQVERVALPSHVARTLAATFVGAEWVAVGTTEGAGLVVVRSGPLGLEHAPLATPSDVRGVSVVAQHGSATAYVVAAPDLATDWIAEDTQWPGGSIEVAELGTGPLPERILFRAHRVIPGDVVASVRVTPSASGFVLSTFEARVDTMDDPILRITWLDGAMSAVGERSLVPGGWGDVQVVGEPPRQDLFVLVDYADDLVRHARSSGPGELGPARPVAYGTPRDSVAWAIDEGRRALATLAAGTVSVTLFDCLEGE